MSLATRRHRIYQSRRRPGLAAQFVAASTQYASIADNATLSMGAGLDCTVAAWIALSAVGTQNVISKYKTVGQLEQLLFYVSGTGFRYQVTSGGTSATSVNVTATTFGIPAIGAFNFVVGSYNGTNLRISVNDGPVQTTAFSADIFNGTDDFTFGRNDAALAYFGGRLDCVGFWKSARGVGGALTAAQITTLYKSGVGMAYRDLPADLKTNLISYWDCDSNFNDSHGANHLVPVNNPTFTTGKR